jgi:hypothetical protein
VRVVKEPHEKTAYLKCYRFFIQVKNTLPKAKSKNPQQAEQGYAQMQQCV